MYRTSEVCAMVGAKKQFVYAVIKRILGSGTRASNGDLRTGRFYVLSFGDLLEIRNIHSFHQSGVQLSVLAETARRARTRFDTNYPFSDRRFLTEGAEVFAETRIGIENHSDGWSEIDGKGILADATISVNDIPYPRIVSKDNDGFVDTAIGFENVSHRKRWGFEEVVDPSLFEPIDYDRYEPIRWYPIGEWGLRFDPRYICLDPAYAFGSPILTKHRVRTETLRDSFFAEGRDLQAAALTYDVSTEAVNIALEFEREKERRLALVEA